MTRFDIESLDDANLLLIGEALQMVLDARTHKHNHLGEEVIVKGSLSKALKLPELIKHLSSTTKKRESARERLSEIWYTLSSATCERSLKLAGVYEPRELSWEDPRSNRHPSLSTDECPD
ncbi:MAG: hypothetical protein HRU20_30180 [Pseudomonadales bacterium]|nr:hypothetical protein [Pseudomonadales bacterium]